MAKYNGEIKMNLKSMPLFLLSALFISVLAACGGDSQSANSPSPEVKMLPTYTVLTPLAPPSPLPTPTATPEVTLSATSHLESGDKYAAQGNYQKAIEEYTEAIRIDPEHHLAFFNRGVVYTVLDQPERMIEDVDEAIRLNPKYAEAYFFRGVTYSILGQHGGAKTTFVATRLGRHSTARGGRDG